MQENHDNIA